MHIDLFLTPVPLDRTSLENKTAVVIDVLRVSTSICAMLTAGARGVIPTDGPGEAGEMWSKIGSNMALLAGERNGVKIENFNFGNSPAEFTRQSVGDRYVVVASTNGSPVFNQVSGAACVISCALVNVSIVANHLAKKTSDVVIVCAGLEGGFSIEDTLCGGMLINKLKSQYAGELVLNDAGSLANLLYESNRGVLRSVIERGEHGRYLASLGFGGDVTLATEVDSMPVLPVLKDGRLVSKNLSEAG